MTAEIQQGLHILSTMTGNASLAILKSHLMPKSFYSYGIKSDRKQLFNF